MGLGAHENPSQETRAGRDTGEVQGPDRRRLEPAVRPAPKGEGRSAEAGGEGYFEDRSAGLRDTKVVVFAEAVALERCADEGRAVVARLPADERGDAAVDLVAAADQRRDRVAAQAVTTGPESERPLADGLL